MSKLELSINVKYVPNWGVWEGLREFISNGRDAEIEFNAPLRVTFYNNTVRIENEGVVLAREALLFGTTSKSGRSDTIGTFGEGIKLSTLALVRAGYPVKIRSGSEVWTPSIEHSDKYDANVLVFNIKGGNKDENRVRVEIGNISKDVWETLRPLFLFLNPKDPDTISTNYGDLLLGEGHRGKLFVKGVFVQTSKLSYGYNFKDAEIDRDRKMVAHWEQSYKTSWIWKEAAAKRPDLLKTFLGLVEDDMEDVKYIGEEMSPNIHDDVAKEAAQVFKERHGAAAVPVSNLAESKALEHLGARGIIVSKSLGAVLKSALGDLETVQDGLRKNVKRKYAWHDLSPGQQSSVSWAASTIESATPAAKLELIDIVEFGDPNIMGQFKEGRALISINVTNDPEETLATLIHEFSHAAGGDGDASHVAVMEKLWVAVVKLLRTKS